MSTVQTGKVVSMHYTLRTADGEELDTSRGDEPMLYLHGHDNIVPGLENGLEGKSVGFAAIIVVTPEEGYGEDDGEAPQAVPRDAFPEDLEIEEGMSFVVENDQGEHIPVWVASVDENAVYLDTNHPLSGVELHFDVEIVAIRDATAEELHHGHPHGADGTGGHGHDHDHDD